MRNFHLEILLKFGVVVKIGHAANSEVCIRQFVADSVSFGNREIDQTEQSTEFGCLKLH